MSKNKKLVPKRRFEEFQNADAWEQHELYKIATMNARIGWQNLRTSEFLSEGNYMLITGTDFEDGKINYSTCHFVEKDRYEQDKNIQIQNGSILITKDGTLGKVAYVEGLTMPATLNAGVFNVKIKNTLDTDGKYLFQYLKAPFLMNYVNKRATGGTIKHLNQNILVDFPVLIPKKDEQARVGDFFATLDQTIAFQQQKLEKMKSMKSAYLSEMFPAEGERKPKRRFPGFTDDWKQRELGKVLGNLTDGDWIEKEHISDKGKYRIIQTGNIGIGEYYNKGKDAKFLNQSSFDVLNGNEIFPGDILISRLAEPAGRTIILPNTGSRMVTAVDVAIVRPNSNFSSYFIQTMMNTNETLKKINEEASGSTRKRISRKNLELIDLIIPEIQEQEKIGNFFKNLDQTIAFQQQKLEKLQNIKKAYLNEMFI